MAVDVIMPQMGESVVEGTITRWLAKVGEAVERDQPLLEIATDKVDAEIPSPATGVLEQILCAEGETVAVDTVLASIAAAGDGAAAAATAGKAATSEAAEPVSEVAEPAAPAGAPAVSEAALRRSRREAGAESLEERLRVFSSPLVRNIAKAENVDLQQVPGTGIHGRVTKRDIEAYLEARKSGKLPEPSKRERAAAAPAAATPAQAAPPGLEYSVPAYREGEAVRIEPMTRIRKLTAAHMIYSRRTSAHVATVFEVDLSAVVAVRQRVKSRFLEAVGTKLTYMPFFFSAVVDALKTYPKLNAAIDGTNIVYKEEIHLGMAVALDEGLIVPVIHHADQLNLTGLAKKANDLADRARKKELKPDEVVGGTFTVTNPGVFGSLFGTPIINQPQVAILCLGAIQKRPVVVTDEFGNDSLSIRPMAYLALSFDHRLIDGADAERFMVRLKETLAEESWKDLEPYGA